MAAPKTVVAGFDGSAQSRSAVWWAAYEASSRNAPLLIVHAFPVPLEELTRLRLPSEALEIGPLRSAAERLLDELAGECGSMLPSLEVHTEVRMGHPAAILGDAAAESGLLVLGPPGLSRTRRVLLGSASAELVRTAPAPVVVVRGEREHQRAAQDPAHFERVVVGVDGSACSVRAIEFAHEFASRHQAGLLALLAWNQLPTDAIPAASGWAMDWGDITRACQRELSESLAGYRERYPEVSVHREVATSQPAAEALLTAAENADLLIVGTHGRGTFRATLLGSVSHAVVHYAPCPVAVVR
ncbi:universal stress protein [Saccharopolyspora erythraea]|uniref:universal stress protein n=1 Tax=Saccharopolyspora erythraea TaxID=1836 RepID=UPI00038D3885|nr:universal stress protein [Saccharopolyspora erythraea]EQD87445.1 universal stress protein [Saccharopolyspora erythraea D]QRK92130.1 universal stress protein [Saccharopolyspora erythraea]